MEFILLVIFILIIIYISNNINKNKKVILNELFVNNYKEIKITKTINKVTFIIYTQNIGLLIAKSIGFMLNKLNLQYNIVLEITEEDVKLNTDNPNEIYIILFPQTLKIFPDVNKYIIYQLEQYKQSTWINDEYKKKIENSLFTLEYSLENYNNFDPEYKKKIFYFPIPIINITYENVNTNYKYDILFVGAPNSRRNNIIRELKKKYKVLFLAKTFNNDLYDLMDQTKIILNLHYYKNAILETTRLNEALFNNKLIISELPDELDIVNKKFYENNIIFIDEIKDDLSNINNLFEKINFYIDNDNYNTALSKNNDFLNKIFEYSFFYFKNCLVKNNLIDNNIDIENNFKNLKNMTNDKIKFIKNIVIVTSNFGNNNENKNDFIGNILNKEYFDWYYFTNSNSKIEGWNIINNNYYEKLGVKLNDNNLKIQFYKTQNINIDLLNKYSYIIWIDPNMIIDNLNFVNDIINLLEKNINSELFIFENYAYNSVNEEQINNLDLNNTIKTKLINQLNSYIENGYTNNKLYESGFLIYKNNDNNKKLMNDWWFESKNDINLTNLSFSYVISKNIIISYILNEGNFTKGKIEGSINKNNLIGHIDNPNIKTIKNNNIIKQLILNNNLDEINNLNIDYKKINYIDGIVWINLHKDIERNKYMKEILNNINIDNYKIVGIDSNNNELLDMFTNVNYERKLDNYEIANTLSHIKAINYLENQKG
jgi:hypothetical protein